MPSVLGDILLDKECPAQPYTCDYDFQGSRPAFFFFGDSWKNWRKLKLLRFFSCQIVTKKPSQMLQAVSLQ
jgi:hypothetical protein